MLRNESKSGSREEFIDEVSKKFGRSRDVKEISQLKNILRKISEIRK